ncbi:MAG: ROK family protein [Chloroflexota bacterium]
MGTGIGGGIVFDGRVYNGRLGGAGEVGHMKLVANDGRPCTCGLTGCLESYAASRVMVERSAFDDIPSLAVAYRQDGTLTAVNEAAGWLGRGLGMITAVLAPEIILIGGSGTLLGDAYLRQVQASFVANAMPAYRAIPLAFTQLGENSGLIGAGILAARGERTFEKLNGNADDADKTDFY